MAQMPAPLPPERRTLYRLLEQAAAVWGDAPALHQPLGEGAYRTYSWVEYLRVAEQVACGLRSLGVGLGDIVALASETRAEFYLADLGIMTNGSIAAAVYTSLAPADQVRTMLASEPKAAFVENAKTMRNLDLAGLHRFTGIRIVFEGEAPGAISFARLLELGSQAIGADPSLPQSITGQVNPGHYAILYLTSGATGEPKMGLVTHSAIVANSDCGPPALPVSSDDVTLAFLPSAHITQRLVVELLMIRMGVPVYFSEGLSKLPNELRSVRPTFFVAPPRVWERVYSSITTEIRKKNFAVRKLFYMGLGVGSEANRAREAGREPAPWVKGSLHFFDKVVFSKIRERLGGRLRVAASGSAPLGKDLAEFYAAIGLPILEGYGLTEGGVVALNPAERPKTGSIGKALPGAEFSIAGDGELLLRGEMVFSGYYRDPEATAAVLRDGWLHTGDIAEIDREGYIYITGRKKELIVSSNGKKIYPSRIEAMFKLEPLVNQVLLIGDRRPYMTAIFTLNLPVAQSIPGAPPAGALDAFAEHPAIREAIQKLVKKVNRALAPFEQIRKFKVLDRDFSIETGELTPTMKIRRAKVLENCREAIVELYMGREEFA